MCRVATDVCIKEIDSEDSRYDHKTIVDHQPVASAQTIQGVLSSEGEHPYLHSFRCVGAFFRAKAYICLIQMGRATRTFRETVDIESAKCKNFRRQLKPDDRERLDKVFDYTRMHADSGTVISIPHKIDMMLISALIEMQREMTTAIYRICLE